MKRYTVIKTFIDFLTEQDVFIFSGKEFCKEAYIYNRKGCIYLDEPLNVSLALAIGMAMNTTKRVFVFIGEGELLKNLSLIAQVGVSKCRNLFIVLFDNFEYQSSGGHPNIFDRYTSKMGFIFSMGVTVLNFTIYFERKEFKTMKNLMTSFTGPLMMIVSLDAGLKKDLITPKYDYKTMISDMRTFVIEEKEISIKPTIDVASLNLDALSFGGTNNGL